MSDPPTSDLDQACRNLRWSLALLDGLIRGGMRQLVLSPGSRSTPLVLAAQRQPDLTLTAIVDERSAGFFALGLARATQRPVGLLCTSGSAPAHWLPAVIEAAEWGAPLVLLSADRPPELRGWGANQTIDQTRLFSPFVREQHDTGPTEDTPAALKAARALGARTAAVSVGPRTGPVHVNVPFREPLVPSPSCMTAPRAPAHRAGTGEPAPRDAQRSGLEDWALDLDIMRGLGARGLIICGPGDHDTATTDAVWLCATELALPVLVDPLSGLRFGPAPSSRIAGYDTLLRNRAAAAELRPDWVIRLGRAPVSKALAAWLNDVPSILLDPAERWCDPSHDAQMQIGGRPERFLRWLAGAGLVTPTPSWLAHWRAAEQHVAELIETHLAEAPWCEGHAIRALIARLPAGDALLCANSLPIRQLDTWSGTRSTPVAIFGNRGASGIDGQVSMLAGINAAGRPAWGLLGDLSLCHDLTGLLLANRLQRPLLVINNGGGRIFDYLPQRTLPGIEALWRVPVGLDLAALARPFGLPHCRLGDGDALEAVLAETSERPCGCLLELCIDAPESQRVHEALWRRIAEARIG